MTNGVDEAYRSVDLNSYLVWPFSYGACVTSMSKGTLAPWDPPKNLVGVGLFRYVRNPMYIGVLATVLGWSIIAGSPLMAAYAVIVGIAFHLRVILYEEPTLARNFGDEWTRYCNSVNRWWPRLLADEKVQ
jgi:protein-S-isoprenylcysteine O-methyltransferase Ste14